MTAVTPDIDTRTLDNLDWQPPCDADCNQPATWRLIPNDCRCTTWLLCDTHTSHELRVFKHYNTRSGSKCRRCGSILIALDARRLE